MQISLDFKTVDNDTLHVVLRQLYGTVRNWNGEEYSISSFLGLGAGVNWYPKLTIACFVVPFTVLFFHFLEQIVLIRHI